MFRGRAFGAVDAEAGGEVVFHTAHSGYQEILTDPSYTGQVVVMTASHVGNYGTNPHDVESRRVRVAGFVVREASAIASSWRATDELADYLRAAEVTGLTDVDTRAVTRHLRDGGARRGVIAIEPSSEAEAVRRAQAVPELVGRDLVAGVSCAEPWEYSPPDDADPLRVVAYDFGIKTNILRLLRQAGCAVTVVPARTPAADVLARDPDGVFLSNGPGDPAPLGYAVTAIRELVASGRPVFGICLGLQLLGLALGGRTYKLKFGHHGANHPVKQLASGRVEITSQNHGFALDDGLFQDGPCEKTHVNLNDGTVEGFRHRELPVFAVQYHPESSPGPHDSDHLFDDFAAIMRRGRSDA